MNFREELLKIGMRIQTSIAKNFREGGRPIKWKPSQRALKGYYSSKKKQTVAGKTLVDTAKLMRSIHLYLRDKEVIIGTNIKYAPVHQFGGSGVFQQTVKPHKRTIKQAFGIPITPRSINVIGFTRQMRMNITARPFMVLQEDDKEFIRNRMKEMIKARIL